MFKYNLLFLVKIIFVLSLLSMKSYTEETKTDIGNIVLGTDEAPVKIKVFSSLTCPHCASFHIKVVEKIKKKYVESGKVQLIFIDFPLDQAAFNASKLLHCVDKKKQMTFLDHIYKNQTHWTNGSNIDEINNNLKEALKTLGITSIQFDKCLTDDVIGDKILNGRIDGHKKYSINATPTIVINEKKFEGLENFESLEKKIEKLI